MFVLIGIRVKFDLWWSIQHSTMWKSSIKVWNSSLNINRSWLLRNTMFASDYRWNSCEFKFSMWNLGGRQNFMTFTQSEHVKFGVRSNFITCIRSITDWVWAWRDEFICNRLGKLKFGVRTIKINCTRSAKTVVCIGVKPLILRSRIDVNSVLDRSNIAFPITKLMFSSDSASAIVQTWISSSELSLQGHAKYLHLQSKITDFAIRSNCKNRFWKHVKIGFAPTPKPSLIV